MFYRMVTFVALFAFLISPSNSYAKSVDQKIRMLENQLRVIQNTYLRNNQAVASAIAKSQSINGRLASIDGKIDANKHLLKDQIDQITNRISDLEHRIQSIEDRMFIFSTQISKALAKIAPKDAAEGKLYQHGLDLINQAKYLEAAATFVRFIKEYPHSMFVANARGWIGEAFFSSGDYKRAIKEFQNFIDKNPRDPNVPNAILKQADAFYELGMLDEAKTFYQKLIQSYSTTSAAKKATLKIDVINRRKKVAQSQTGYYEGSYPTQTLQQKQGRTTNIYAPPSQNVSGQTPIRPMKDF